MTSFMVDHVRDLTRRLLAVDQASLMLYLFYPETEAARDLSRQLTNFST